MEIQHRNSRSVICQNLQRITPSFERVQSSMAGALVDCYFFELRAEHIYISGDELAAERNVASFAFHASCTGSPRRYVLS